MKLRLPPTMVRMVLPAVALSAGDQDDELTAQSDTRFYCTNPVRLR